jgi:hypothetical protein
MTNQVSQKEFNQMVMLVALAMCFKSNEEYLSEDQIIGRGYTPIESYGKSCIAKLIDEGAIKFKLIEPTFPIDGAKGIYFIKRPVNSEQELEPYLYKSLERIQSLVGHSFDYTLYLRALYLDVLACEAIEYANYYAKKNGLYLQKTSPANAKLQILLAENAPEKINALIWRSIKSISKNISNEVKEVMDSAFEYYVHHQKQSIAVEEYSRPSQLRTSVLSGILELFRGNARLNSSG